MEDDGWEAKKVSLRDLCKPYPAVDRASTLEEALKVFSRENLDFLVVLDGAKPAGILSSFDVLEKMIDGAKPGKVAVEDVMSPALLLLDAALSPEDAAHIMLAHKHWMAVVAEKGEYRGVVTAQWLLKGVLLDLTHKFAYPPSFVNPPDKS